MTLPKGFSRTDSFGYFPIPNKKELSKPMIYPDLLDVPRYKIKIVKGAEFNPGLDMLAINPLEVDASIFFYNGKSKAGFTLPIKSISDVKIAIQTKGSVLKKQNVLVEISLGFGGAENSTIRVDVEDKDINELIHNIKSIQNKLQDGSAFWTAIKIHKKTSSGIITPIEIYPLIPFLSQGEEIVWSNISTKGLLKKKDNVVNIITNYRIFQYDYVDHDGSFILLDEDVVVNNQRRVSNSNISEIYSKSRSLIPGNKTDKTKSTTVGDLEVISNRKTSITLKNINDPESLIRLIGSITNECNFTTGSATTIQKSETTDNTVTEENGNNVKKTQSDLENNDIVCDNCNTKNPMNSKFCYKCGQKLNGLKRCNRCNQINVHNALFCSQCGNKL